MKGESDLMADPDIRRIKEVTDTVRDKIDTFFTGVELQTKALLIELQMPVLSKYYRMS